MPSKFWAGCVRRRCLRWRWRSWVVATASAEMPYQVAGDQLAVREAAGKHAVQRGLVGDWTIGSFGKIARGPIYRADGAEVFSDRRGVQDDRRAWAIRCARCASAVGSEPGSAGGAGSSRKRAWTWSAGASRAFAGAPGVPVMVDPGTGRAVSTFSIRNLMLRGSTRSRGGQLRSGAGVVIAGRSGGRRGDSRRPPACRPGLGRSGDAPRIGRRAGDGSGR